MTVPVFYHVPKNAGTYVTNLSLLFFRGYRRTKTVWNDYNYETIKNIEIINEHGTVARLLCGDPDNECVSDKHIDNDPLDTSHHTVSYEKNIDKTCIKKLFIFQIIIEDAGFHLAENIINSLIGSQSYQEWIILREPFSRTVSWYSYITSDRSSHEPLHQYVTSSFENYIKSPDFESNWVMRKLVGVPDSEDFTEQHHKHAISRLDKFEVYDIQDVDSMVDKMFETSYSITRDDWPPHATTPGRNQNPVKGIIKFESLPDDIQKMYTSKTYWDNLLWDKYCKRIL